MVDNYHKLHQFIITIEPEHLMEVAETQVTKVTSHTTIIADTRAGHIVTIDLIVIIDLIATIDLGTDMTITTATDRKAIIEIIIIIIMITVTIQITEISAIVIIVMTTITVQITIIVTIQEIIRVHLINIHGHHINPDHLTIEIEVHIIIVITITGADTLVTIEIDIQVTEIKSTDEIIIQITAINRNHTIDKVEMA